MKAKSLLAFAAALALLTSSMPGHAAPAEKIKVVATTTDLKGLIAVVGGDLVNVEHIASPTQDPHSIELKPAHLAQLKNAALVIRVGLDHEPWLERAKITAPVVDASRGVRLMQTETPRLRAEKHSHTHAFGNTHYWLDPENAKLITASMVEALSALSPADRPKFEANRAQFIKQLNERIGTWKAALAPHRGAKLVVVHDSWAYFADYFGLSIVAAAEPNPGVPPSPAELAKLLSRMRESGVRVLIADPSSNPLLVRQIADKSQAQPVILSQSIGADPAVTDYLTLIDTNVQRLAKALR